MKVIVTVVPRNLDGLASEAAGNGGVNFHQGEKGRHRKMEGKGTTEDEVVRWHHQLNQHEFE